MCFCCRKLRWLERLYLEDCVVGFDRKRCELFGFRFLPQPQKAGLMQIKLDGMGPKLLVSDLSTAQQPLLRWRMCVRGNTAVEFGVVPLSMQVRLAAKMVSSTPLHG